MLGGRMVQASGSNGGGGGGGGGVTVLVQRGAQSMGSSTSVSVSLDNAVDTSQSFILVSRAVGNTSSPNGFLVEAYFDTQGSSVSSFTLERYGTTSGLTVYWQVVQMSNIAV
ncbi:MAG TPA: hypothetical protein VG753_02135, partial [Candidatus Paceibacterota bacterium]|nr:hypothetical protein [Candidatus Paceibacterota bacterium]